MHTHWTPPPLHHAIINFLYIKRIVEFFFWMYIEFCTCYSTDSIPVKDSTIPVSVFNQWRKWNYIPVPVLIEIWIPYITVIKNFNFIITELLKDYVTQSKSSKHIFEISVIVWTFLKSRLIKMHYIIRKLFFNNKNVLLYLN